MLELCLHVWYFACLSLCFFHSSSVCLSVCLSVRLFVCPSVSEMSPQDEKTLKKIYTTIGGPAAFSSSETLYQEARKINPKLTRKTVKKFLEKSYVYQKHKPVSLKKFRNLTLPVITSGPRQVWDCDLAFLTGSRARYIGGLICADAFTSKVLFSPITSKTSSTVASALQKLVATQNRNEWPALIRTDKVSTYLLGCCGGLRWRPNANVNKQTH